MRKKTRVAFFADILIKDFDGASRTMFQIIERIPRDRFDFTFFTGKTPQETFPYPVTEIANLKIPFNDTYTMAMPVASYFPLKRALDRFEPDVIHIASPSLLGNFAIDYAKKRNLPIVSIYHTHFISYVEYYTKNLPLVTDVVKSAVISGQRKFYNKIDKVLVPTETIINELEGYGFESKRMNLWPRGIDQQIFSPTKKDPRFIREKVGNDKPNLLFASRLVWEKNLQTLIDLYHLCEEEGRPFNFIIVGDGVAFEEMKAAMPGAYFAGKVDHPTLAKYYASSDVFVFPSVSETYGNVVIEAMACGCPCVIANGGGSASFIRQGHNGFLCEPQQASDYLNKIRLTLEADTLRRQFISESLDYVRNLSWDALVNRYFSIIYELTAESIRA